MHFKVQYFCWFFLFFASCKSQRNDIYNTKNFYQVDSTFNNGKIDIRFYKSKVNKSVSYYDRYTPDGWLFLRVFLKNDKANGPVYFYHSNGVVASSCMRRNDLTEGECLSFDEEGRLGGREYYKNNKEDGEWIHYDTAGTIIRKKYFKDGIKVGDWLVFNSAGRVIEKKHYRNGKKEGVWLKYDDNGRVIKKSYYKNDVIFENIEIPPE